MGRAGSPSTPPGGRALEPELVGKTGIGATERQAGVFWPRCTQNVNVGDPELRNGDRSSVCPQSSKMTVWSSLRRRKTIVQIFIRKKMQEPCHEGAKPSAPFLLGRGAPGPACEQMPSSSFSCQD